MWPKDSSLPHGSSLGGNEGGGTGTGQGSELSQGGGASCVPSATPTGMVEGSCDHFSLP